MKTVPAIILVIVCSLCGCSQETAAQPRPRLQVKYVADMESYSARRAETARQYESDCSSLLVSSHPAGRSNEKQSRELPVNELEAMKDISAGYRESRKKETSVPTPAS